MVKLLSFASRVLQVICQPRISTTEDRPECNGNTVVLNLQHRASYELGYPGEVQSTLKSNLSL